MDAALRHARISHGIVTYPQGGSFGPRLQRSVQLIFVHDGSARIAIGQEEVHIQKGFGALLLPGLVEYFQFSRTAMTTHSWVHYWSAPQDESLLEQLTRAQQVRPVTPALARLIQRLLAEPPAPSVSTTAQAYEILYRYLESDGLGDSSPRALEEARTYVEQHLGEELGVERIAVAVAVSRSHLFRLFRAHLGVTPAEYLWQRRVQLGIELLQETGLSVAAVAERAGFRTPKHLSRRVRDATGMSPTTLREAALRAPLGDGTG